MDILRFINSRDVREHLKNIGYEFTPLEAAWLVWQCEGITLKEKHAAWQEIIDTRPDCEVPERVNCRNWKSLHDLLRRYMEMENKYIEQFFADEPDVVYQYDEHYTDCPWSDFRSCKMYKNLMDAEKDLCEEKEYVSVHFRKEWVNTQHKVITVEILASGNIKKIDIEYEDNDEDTDLMVHSFSGMYFRFPIPFQRGDIICHYRDNIGGYDTYFWQEMTCVYSGSHLDAVDEKRSYFYRDICDMNLSMYYQANSGMLYGDNSAYHGTCMDYEYYRGELDGKKRILKYLSRQMRGELDIARFANAYYIVLTEESRNLVHDIGWVMSDNLMRINSEKQYSQAKL